MPAKKRTMNEKVGAVVAHMPAAGSLRDWPNGYHLGQLDPELIPGWIAHLREAETEIRQLRARLESQGSGRSCAGCGGTLSGRADRLYCSAACRKAGSRASRL